MSDITNNDILNEIDISKININDKKKRGRPRKNTNVINNKNKIYKSDIDNDEIILHLPISKKDLHIDSTIDDNNDNDNDNDNDNNLSDNNSLQIENSLYLNKMKKLIEENEELKKYMTEITPMYFTEIKVMPVDLNLFDVNGDKLTPKKTNICCWWCTYNFDCIPTYLPDKYHNSKFYVMGCFCSFNCACAYNLNMNDNKVNERYTLLKQLYYFINKDNIRSYKDIDINPSPPREILDKFGGKLSIDEYRKNSKILGREYHILYPPFIPLSMAVEELTNTNVIKNKKIKIGNTKY
jgi:hypothetical protein